LSETYPKWDYLTQYRESDFAFVSRIMERAGIYYYFTHTQSGHEMVLVGFAQQPRHRPRIRQIPVTQRRQRRGAARSHHRLAPIHQITSAGATLQAHDFRLRLGSDIKGKAGVPAEHEQDEFQLYDYAGM
jgi:type VI secretion system secreted protein VgrG